MKSRGGTSGARERAKRQRAERGVPLAAVRPRGVCELTTAFACAKQELCFAAPAVECGLLLRADESQHPAINEHDTVGKLTKRDVAAGIVLLDATIESRVLEVDVAQSARNGVDPQHAVDGDAASLFRRESDATPNLV